MSGATVRQCCHSRNWALQQAQRELRLAAIRAARNPTQANLDAVKKYRAERDEARHYYNEHAAWCRAGHEQGEE